MTEADELKQYILSIGGVSIPPEEVEKYEQLFQCADMKFKYHEHYYWFEEILKPENYWLQYDWSALFYHGFIWRRSLNENDPYCR